MQTFSFTAIMYATAAILHVYNYIWHVSADTHDASTSGGYATYLQLCSLVGSPETLIVNIDFVCKTRLKSEQL